uniref:E3 ubiquitin-protein ligase TTC3/DZIP3 domain-containing protein n=1 Tax=Trichogramma kaykai TaxID=54128 RepID=A0ABD2XL23_9HYME
MVNSSYSPYISCGDDYLRQFSGHGRHGDDSELTSVLKVAANEYMRCLDGTETKWTIPYTYYKKAKGLVNILNVDRTTENLINYLLGFCLNKFAVTLDDFTEAVQTLESIDIDFVQKFPAVYAVLAELHCKLCRHDYALYYLNEGLSFLKKLDELNIFYLPQTKIVLKDNGRNNKIWDYIKEKCSNFQMPDYVCVHSKCNNITKPYTTPSKQIYFKDPAFSDIIQVQCSHDPPCSLYFHKPCWFLEKEKHCLYHQTDEMIIDNHNVPCLNINCQSDPKPSVINSIGVMNAKGDIVFELKYPRTNTSKQIAGKPSKNHEAKDHSVLDVSKGAIKKDFTGLNTLKNSMCQKSDDLFKQEVEKFGVQDYNPFRINNRNSERMNRVVVVKEGVEPKLKVTNRETEFLFSFFHEMISKNVGTTWVEVYDEYMKIKDNLLKPTEDIRDFLLSTEAFEETPLDITSSDATVNETIKSIMSTLAAHNERHKEKSSANAYYDLLDDENHVVQSNQTSINSPKDKTKNSCVETFNFPDSHEFKASDKDYLEKIINHSKSMEVELQEQIETNAHLGQMVRQQAAQIEHFETERQDLWDKIESLSKVISASTNLKKKYEQINQENLRLKQELLQMTLEVKKSKLNDLCQDQYPNKIDENKRKEILANFQEELKIIRDSLNNEWNQKYSALEQVSYYLF